MGGLCSKKGEKQLSAPVEPGEQELEIVPRSSTKREPDAVSSRHSSLEQDSSVSRTTLTKTTPTKAQSSVAAAGRTKESVHSVYLWPMTPTGTVPPSKATQMGPSRPASAQSPQGTSEEATPVSKRESRLGKTVASVPFPPLEPSRSCLPPSRGPETDAKTRPPSSRLN